MQLSASQARYLEQETPYFQTYWSVKRCRVAIQQVLAKEKVKEGGSKISTMIKVL